jgi:hypothetical protein
MLRSDANGPRVKLTVVCNGWKPLRKNTLLGFARIQIAELDLRIHDVAVHAKGDRMWAALPSRPWVQNGAVVTGDDGKVQYSVLFEFTRRETRDAFSQRVIDAVIRFDLHALEMREAVA